MGKRQGLTSGKIDRTRATHILVKPTGRLEFRKSLLSVGGAAHCGWASRWVSARGVADNWIYFGPELPDGAIKL